MHTSRRTFLALTSAAATCAIAPARAAARTMTARPIPKSGEMLPVIGLGSSKAVQQLGADGPQPLTEVLRTLIARGGKVVDTWPRNPPNDSKFGAVINTPELQGKLFITGKIDVVGKDAGIAQFRATQTSYGRKTIDLLQIFSLTDLATHWASLRAIKDAGEARYIGATVSEDKLHAALADFIQKEAPDTVQMNYSISERMVEDRLLPLAADKGVAVIVNRPFMNGALFGKLQGKPLPAFAAEIGCQTWAQYSLKYILGHPAVTCVLAETTKAQHMAENAEAGANPLPDAAMRKRMIAYVEEVI